jgi:hypothetical protein
MQTAGIANILTLNANDFNRYTTVIATTPGEVTATSKP